MVSRPANAILSRAAFAAAFLTLAALHARAADPAPEPDVLLFTDGEKLIGHLVRSAGSSVTFHSDMAGDITVDWSKIKELHTSGKFAVIPKNVKLHKHEQDGQIPKGTVAMTDQKLEVRPSPEQSPQTVPVADAAYVIDQATFEKVVLHRPGIFAGWKGAVSAGASLVEATQNSRTFTGSVALVRAVPSESWLDTRNRTTFDFSASYGKLTQPNTPTVKTSIYHLDAERDEYFTARVYGFGQLAYDHNFSQGLDLEQAYGGGIGWTVIKTANQTLDLKASMSYLRQQFQEPAQNKNLVGSTFGERYTRALFHSVLFNEQLTVTPAWNNTSAYSANGSAGLAMPVYKRLSLSLGAIDTFLNDPPPGFKKNSFQFTMGLSYALP